MRELREQVNGVSQAAQTSMVDQALLMVCQLVSRPPNVFDPYALIGALEHLEDVARRAGHVDVKFTAVLSSCKKLPPSPRLGDLVTHILGRQLQRCISRQFLCRGHPEMVVQYILDPPRIGRTPGVGVVNHRQLEMSGV